MQDKKEEERTGIYRIDIKYTYSYNKGKECMKLPNVRSRSGENGINKSEPRRKESL